VLHTKPVPLEESTDLVPHWSDPDTEGLAGTAFGAADTVAALLGQPLPPV